MKVNKKLRQSSKYVATLNDSNLKCQLYLPPAWVIQYRLGKEAKSFAAKPCWVSRCQLLTGSQNHLSGLSVLLWYSSVCLSMARNFLSWHLPCCDQPGRKSTQGRQGMFASTFRNTFMSELPWWQMTDTEQQQQHLTRQNGSIMLPQGRLDCHS